MITDKRAHWETVYQTKPLTDVSWYEPVPETSLKLIEGLGLSKDAAIIDIGGGDSLLADNLLNLGYTNVTVLDISKHAIERAKLRLGPNAPLIKWIESDMLLFEATTKFDLWHDRAAFHFLTDKHDQQMYLDVVNRNVNNAGQLIIGAFSLDGPAKCSNLPVQQYSEGTLGDFFGKYFIKQTCIVKDHHTPFKTIQQFVFCVFKKRG